MTINMPAKFEGTPEEAAANWRTHRFVADGDPENAGDARCWNCDVRPGGTHASWPCGADVPRVEVER